MPNFRELIPPPKPDGFYRHRGERVGADTSGGYPKLLLTAKRNLIRSLFILLTV
jgi:hypothetical protein